MQRFVTFVSALALLVVGGCSGPSDPPVCTPGESRSCACSDGRAGAQTCNEEGSALGVCQCDDADAGAPADSGVRRDAGVLMDSGAELDAGPPPPRDAGRDSGPADGGPAWGDCWPTPAPDCTIGSGICDRTDGCEMGETCRLTRSDPAVATPDGPPTCQPAGTVQYYQEDTCCWSRTGEDLCGSRQFCIGRPGVFGCYCRLHCNPDGEPCPGGRSCVPYRFPGDEAPAGFELHYCR